MPINMVSCPTCGSANSAKRNTCFSCQQPLHGPAAVPLADPGAPSCKNCISASIFAPQGQRMGPQEVWCNKEGAAKPANAAAGKCFQKGFTWSKFEALD